MKPLGRNYKCVKLNHALQLYEEPNGKHVKSFGFCLFHVTKKCASFFYFIVSILLIFANSDQHVSSVFRSI